VGGGDHAGRTDQRQHGGSKIRGDPEFHRFSPSTVRIR
jgi:hypothetical protein